MFFTGYSVCEKFRSLIFHHHVRKDLEDEGTCMALFCAAKKEGGLDQLASYFSKQSEILRRLRYHLYSESQFFMVEGRDQYEQKQLGSAYDICRQLHEGALALVKDAEAIIRNIHDHQPLKDGTYTDHGLRIWDRLDTIDRLVIEKREKIGYAIDHLKKSVAFYHKIEQDLISLENEMDTRSP